MSKRKGKLSMISVRDGAFILNALELYGVYLRDFQQEHPERDFSADLAHCDALRDRLEADYRATFGESLVCCAEARH